MDAEPQPLDDALERRVLALWSSKLGVDADVLDQAGLVVVTDGRDFAAERRTMVRTARGTLLLAAPAEASVAAADPAAYVIDVGDRAHGIGLLHYRAVACVGQPDPRTRVLGVADRPLLDALQHVQYRCNLETRRRPNSPAGAASPSGASLGSPRRSSLRLVSLLPRSLQRSSRLGLSCS